MTKPSKARADGDGGWKDIIEDFTEEFFEFYFPEVHAAIDFAEPVRFLDKELRAIVTESEVAGREADKPSRSDSGMAAPSGSWSMSQSVRTAHPCPSGVPGWRQQRSETL